MQKDLKMNSKEFTILNLLHVNHKPNEDEQHQFPLVYGGGEFVIKCEKTDNYRDQRSGINDRYSFIVM